MLLTTRNGPANTGTGWTQTNGWTPAFLVQGTSDAARARSNRNRATQGFGGNLFIDPCTGCNYDPNGSGLDVRGPDNCISPGDLYWTAVPFVAAKSGVPTRISASIVHAGPALLPAKEHRDVKPVHGQLRLGTGDPLVSGIATVPLNAVTCDLAVATLSGRSSLATGSQILGCCIYGRDPGCFGPRRGTRQTTRKMRLMLADGWEQSSFGTPGFLVQ